MRGAQKHKVQRIVVTSSCASIWKPSDKNQTHFTPDVWTDTDSKGCAAYEKSKTLAEKAAWDFLKALPENERFELVCINPGLIMGPNLNKCNFTSGDIVKGLLMG